MADKFVISGVDRKLDGEYDFDMDNEPFNALEWRWIKKISGYLPLTIEDGFAGADPDLVIALAAICLSRAGRIRKEDVLRTADLLAEVPFDGAAIRLEIGDDEEAEGDDGPPAEAAATKSPRKSSGGRSQTT